MANYYNTISFIISVLMLYACAMKISATVYTVGDKQGWSTGVDYSTWTSDKTFKVGDSLVFNYSPSMHTVIEVSSSDYKSCSSSNAITTDNTGSTSIPLKTSGDHYFICGAPGHCDNGMKLHVTVASSSSGGSSSSTPSSPSSSTPATTTPASSKPVGTSSSTSSRTAPTMLSAFVLMKLAIFIAA